MEFCPEAEGQQTVLGNIYVAKVESISGNINAAFLLLENGLRAYFPLQEQGQLIYASGCNPGKTLRPGDEVLVQVSRDAMKGKLPAVTANISLTGKYLVLTTGNKKTGFSRKLCGEDRSRLKKWLTLAGPDENSGGSEAEHSYGIVVRTNAADASKEEFLRELTLLQTRYEAVIVHGRNRTCYSLLYRPEAFYVTAVRDLYTDELTEIVTDLPKVFAELKSYLQTADTSLCEKLRLYEDKLLPLYKLYCLERAAEEIASERVWLKSGGFLVIQQTEAFVSIDVNTGKYVTQKKAEETFRKINREAAEEILRQLRLRNLSGIILIDFINMENPDHQEELFHVLKKLVKKDPVTCTVVDITPLHILEMTRKKIRRPVIEDLRNL